MDKAQIIAQLKKDLLPLQGYKPSVRHQQDLIGLGPILSAFPQRQFPLGVIHECIVGNHESAATTSGFISSIAGMLMGSKGIGIWITPSRIIYPPALTFFNIEPGNILFIESKKEKEILWITEEALRCEVLTTVVSEVPGLSFTASRRLQLAVEKSRVTGFIIRRHPRLSSPTASLCTWKITSLPGDLPGEMPGVGYPRWNVELLKVRNGHPASWKVVWSGGRFHHLYREAAILPQREKKTG